MFVGEKWSFLPLRKSFIRALGDPNVHPQESLLGQIVFSISIYVEITMPQNRKEAEQPELKITMGK